MLPVLVVIEFALGAVRRAVKEMHRGPEQVFEVGFEPCITERGDECIEDVGERDLHGRFVGQRAGIGFVLVRTVAVELKLSDDGRGGRALAG